MTEMEITSVLRQARAHYKGGYKSSNKVYAQNNTPKERARNNIVDDPNPIGHDILALRRSLRPYGLNMEQKGEHYLTSGITYGNCGEMAAVALRLCRLRFGPRIPVFTAELRPPGDHIFLVLSVNGRRPSSMAINVYQLSREDPANFWVIDCWSNVACSVRDYPHRLRTKFKKWATDGKEIVDMEGEGVDPSNPRIVHHFLGSPIEWKRR